jgi:2-succinyl-6-hydroxy-2,4-cyclohexadiene-1-carboxylate synthase
MRLREQWAGPLGARQRVWVEPPQGGEARLGTVLLLHGFLGSVESLGALARELTLRGACAVRVELLGHGESDAPRDQAAYRLEQQALTLHQVWAQQGQVPWHVVGYSMGGRLALTYAVAYPQEVRSLTLVGASPGVEDPEERKQRFQKDLAWARLLREEGLDAMVERWQAQPLFATQKALPPGVQEEQHRWRTSHRHPWGLEASLVAAGQGAMEPLWAALGDLCLPLLYVAGEEDARYREVGKRVALRVVGARWETIPGCGHNVTLEAPSILAERLVAFWQEISLGKAASFRPE